MSTVNKSLKPQSKAECLFCCCAPSCYCCYAKCGCRKGSDAAEVEMPEPAKVDEVPKVVEPSKAVSTAPKPQTMTAPKTKPGSVKIDLDSINLDQCIASGKSKTRLDAPALEDVIRRILAPHDQMTALKALFTAYHVQLRVFVDLTSKVNWQLLTCQQCQIASTYYEVSDAILKARGTKKIKNLGLADEVLKEQKEEEEEKKKEEEEGDDEGGADGGDEGYEVPGLDTSMLDGLQDQLEEIVNEIINQLLEGACDYLIEVHADMLLDLIGVIVPPAQMGTAPAKFALKIPMKLYRFAKRMQKLLNPPQPKKEDFLPMDQFKEYCLQAALKEDPAFLEDQLAAVIKRSNFFHALTVLTILTMDSVQPASEGRLYSRQQVALYRAKYVRCNPLCGACPDFGGPHPEITNYAKETEARTGQEIWLCGEQCCCMSFAMACEEFGMITRMAKKKALKLQQAAQGLQKSASNLVAAPKMETMKGTAKAGKEFVDEAKDAKESAQGMVDLVVQDD